MIEVIERARRHGPRLAVVDHAGEHSYEELLHGSARAATTLLDGSDDLEEDRVAFMIPPSFEYVCVQWGIWRAGGIAVPLSLTHPAPELAYVLDDARPTSVVASEEYDDLLQPLAAERGIRWITLEEIHASSPGTTAEVSADRRAMMLYTSGTTGRPKGVVTTHANITAQIRALVDAWGWSSDDRILLTLPLHHLHGILNVVSCALWSGAVCEMHPRFEAEATWDRIRSGDLTLYMAVPTIYRRLIDVWERADEQTRREMSEACRDLRLMVSGSAALPVPTLDQWREISGHTLLERYGMTEIGMALANPLHGERRPGHVGSPLPGVEVRLVGEGGSVSGEGTPGEIQIRGANVFLEYWDRPDATAEAFTEDGWFQTGDIAVRENGVYRIMGRNSVDIIKTGGEKVSALEIEAVLLAHSEVNECAVVGIDDPDWGERVVAVVVPKSEAIPDADDLKDWCRGRLAPYKIPKEILTIDELPRNVMGKVVKPRVVDLVTKI